MKRNQPVQGKATASSHVAPMATAAVAKLCCIPENAFISGIRRIALLYRGVKAVFLAVKTTAPESATPQLPNPSGPASRIAKPTCPSPIPRVTQAGIRTRSAAVCTAWRG